MENNEFMTQEMEVATDGIHEKTTDFFEQCVEAFLNTDAGETLENLPEMKKGIEEGKKSIDIILGKCIDSSDNSLKDIYASENILMDAFIKEAASEDNPEEKKYYYEKAEECMTRKHAKDSEHMNNIINGTIKVVAIAAWVGVNFFCKGKGLNVKDAVKLIS